MQSVELSFEKDSLCVRVYVFVFGYHLHLDTQPAAFVFHENCGTNIRLTNFKMTAKKIEPYTLGNGQVVSRDAMSTNVLYEV